MPSKSFQLLSLVTTMLMMSFQTQCKRGPDDSRVLKTLWRAVFPADNIIDLPDKYFAVRNPFNESDTLFRFNLTGGKMSMQYISVVNETKLCKFDPFLHPSAVCRFSILGAFATYEGKLSYGRPVKDSFTINITIEKYYESNPVDISGYFNIIGDTANAKLRLVGVAVTEFVSRTTSLPPFEKFTVFEKFNYNETLISKVRHEFDDFVFRRCKQDMRQQAVEAYTAKMIKATEAVGTFDSTSLLK
uniref:Putative secreted protein n=1 Tax=Amblyomma triste TaxID=251400 RepID=A0A023G373_AMBTT